MRSVLAAVGAVLAAAAMAAPAAAASPSPAATRPVIGPAIGGVQLSGRGVLVNYPSRAVPRLPTIKASAWVIADAGTGQVLAAKDPHGWYRPASTLKVLTAISLIPALNPDAMVVASKQATTVSPNIVGLLPGHSYQVSDLFTALLTISANDAAMALAQATGSLGHGMAVINAEARHLQADDTVAVTPNGLDAPGQHTSAYDLALFARQALTMPEFMQIEATRTAMFPLHRRHSIELFNQNTMLDTYRGDLGGKIGWTRASKTTFIAWARRNGHTLIVTLMHCVPLTEMTVAAKLLNWGFAMDGKVTPVGTLARPRAAGVAGPAATHPAPAHPATGGSPDGPGARSAAAQHPGHQVTGTQKPGGQKPGGQRSVRLAQVAGFPTISWTAGIGALVLAALVAAGIAMLLRRRPGGGSPPGR